MARTRGTIAFSAFGLVMLGAALVVSASACNAITGASDFVLGDSPAGTSSGEPGGGDGYGGSTSRSDGSTLAPEDGSLPDGATSLVDGGDAEPPPNAFHAGFDAASECLAWAVSGGTRAWDVDGHNASGSCRLCAGGSGLDPAAGASMTRTVTATVDGRFGPQVWLKRPDGTTSPTRYSFTFVKNGVTIANGGGLSTTWAVAGGSRVGGNAGDSITLTIGLPEAGAMDCVLVDDVIVRAD